MTIMGLIPARGGSKRVPHKNLAPCGGRPLLAWTADAALGAACLDGVWLSTDDPAIAAAGRELGLSVPELRPAALSGDAVAMLPVVQHALDHWMGEDVSAVVLLQPTSPLRVAADIEAVGDLLETSGADSVVTVTPVPHRCHPLKALRLDAEGGVRPFFDDAPAQGETATLTLAPAYARNGPAVLATRAPVIAAGSLYGRDSRAHVMPADRSIDIDEPFDLWIADQILRTAAPGSGEGRS